MPDYRCIHVDCEEERISENRPHCIIHSDNDDLREAFKRRWASATACARELIKRAKEKDE